MSAISARALLDDVDPLSHAQRCRHIVRAGRALPNREATQRLLDGLHAGGRAGQQAALLIARTVGDGDYPRRCLLDESVAETVRAQALGAVVDAGRVEQWLVDLVPDLPMAVRTRLYTVVRQRRARPLANALIPVVRARFGDHEAGRLLAACDAETLMTHLAEPDVPVVGRQAIGGEHPDVLLDWLDTELVRLPRARWSVLLEQVAPGLSAAAVHRPGRVLAVLRRVVPVTAIPGSLRPRMALLARHDPEAALGIYLAQRRPGDVPGGRSTWRALTVLPDDRLVRLAACVRREDAPALVRAIPPARRLPIYRALVAGETTPTPWSLSLLDLLPRWHREAEAQRLLELPVVASDERLQLGVVARLLWPQGHDRLREWTRRSDAIDRALGYSELITCATVNRGPEVLDGLLGALGRVRNEQDPVRGEVLDRLASVPDRRFDDRHAAQLLRLITDALESRDRSVRTRYVAARLAVAMLRSGARDGKPDLLAAGLSGLDLLGNESPTLSLYGLDRDLPRGAEREVFAALRERIGVDARRGEYRIALAVAAGLRRRAWHLDDLQKVLGEACSAKPDHVARQAIDLWLAPPQTRDTRVEQLYRADRSTVAVQSVLTAIAFRRTDLVGDMLTKSLSGRYQSKRSRLVPLVPRAAVALWSRRQWRAYAERLEQLIGSSTPSLRERVAAIRMLGEVPGTVESLRALLNSTEVAVVEAALAALAHTDHPARVLPDLMARVDTDHARVAAYAADRSARFVRPSHLADALRPALVGHKVTAIKEAVRLLALHRVPDAPALILEVWQRPGVHRDVRRAIIGALPKLIDDERAWLILEDAGAAEPSVSEALLDLSAERIPGRWRGRFAGLIRTYVARVETLDRDLDAVVEWVPFDRTIVAALVDRLTNLSTTLGWREVIDALVASGGLLEEVDPVLDAAAALLDRVDTTVDENRDLPARQRLSHLIWAVVWNARANPPAGHASAGALADLLAGQDGWADRVVELAQAAIPDDPTTDRAAIDRLVRATADPVWAWHSHISEIFTSRLEENAPRVPEEPLAALVEELLAAAAPAGPLLGLTFAKAAAGANGWESSWQNVVVRLRSAPDGLVRLAARSIAIRDE
ncbi:hypothetical protein [Millisia brevis]|uniref:hypothetical protein n=1 Tax=Millisia brevis TaxID=264148 RepID=UPI00082AE8D2|nr:hypothetical protein [Millisia brevis]